MKQYPGDVWVMFYPKRVMFYHKKVMLMWNIPALSCCSDWRDKSFPLVGRSFPACGKNLSHWRELPLHLLLLSQHYNLTKTSPTISKHHQFVQNITKTSPICSKHHQNITLNITTQPAYLQRFRPKSDVSDVFWGEN